MLKTLENIAPTKTAGELHNDLGKTESVSCTPLDLGYSFSDDTYKGVIECIERHWNVFGDHVTKFCVYCILAPGEGNLRYLIRRKFAAWPYLPDPMPNQSVWLVDKIDGTAMFLWSLPTPEKMAELSESFTMIGKENRTKAWCDAFFNGFPSFWECIRTMHGIDFLSESEFNRRNREMGGQYIDDNLLGLTTDSTYLPNIRIKKLEAMGNVALKKFDNNIVRQTN